MEATTRTYTQSIDRKPGELAELLKARKKEILKEMELERKNNPIVQEWITQRNAGK